MKTNKITKVLTLMMVMITTMSLSALAGSNKNYYSKVTATAVGEGKVYVSFNTESAAPEYAETSSAESGEDSQSSAPSHTYYLYAQANDGYKFAGWYNNEECTGDFLSTDETYQISITANTNVSSATKNYYAKFEIASIPVFRKDKDHGYINLSEGATTKYGLTVENLSATFTSSNEAVLTIDENGVVTPVTNGTAIVTAECDGYETMSTIVTVIDDLTAGKTQIGNSDFEDWSNVTSSNHAPNNWNSFETNEGTWASFARAQQVQMVEQPRPGSNGFYCVDIWSRSVMGTVAQGNLTLGYVNAGATTAVNAQNHNRSKITDPNKSETIDKIPSALKAWVKFVPAAENAEHPNARLAATIHDAHNYITQGAPQFETEQNASYAVAQGALNFPACEWTEITVPIELTGNAVVDGQLYIIVNISTNADPGQGQAGDHLFIDDIELVYADEDYDTTPLTMTEAKWATFCAPMAVNVPYGMKAYTVDGVEPDGETLAITEVVDGVIAANTPVVLSAEAAVSRKAYGKATAIETPTAGLLTGVYEETAAPVGSYVLQNHDGVVGFYKVDANSNATVGANRAYLNATASARFLGFEGEETAINAIDAMTSGKAQIFDLNGRRLNSLQKGINIVNGVKILVK